MVALSKLENLGGDETSRVKMLQNQTTEKLPKLPKNRIFIVFKHSVFIMIVFNEIKVFYKLIKYCYLRL